MSRLQLGADLVGTDGATHTASVDLSYLRSIPNVDILALCTAFPTGVLQDAEQLAA